MRKVIPPAKKEAIRRRYQEGIPPRFLALEFGVAPPTITMLVKGLDHAPWQKVDRRTTHPEHRARPIPGLNVQGHHYQLQRRCGHWETFLLHWEPTPYYIRCVREEWCATCKTTRHIKHFIEV